MKNFGNMKKCRKQWKIKNNGKMKNQWEALKKQWKMNKIINENC